MGEIGYKTRCNFAIFAIFRMPEKVSKNDDLIAEAYSSVVRERRRKPNTIRHKPAHICHLCWYSSCKGLCDSFESDDDESCSSDFDDYGSEEEDEVGAVIDDASHNQQKLQPLFSRAFKITHK
jgi:hypothetical protein